MVTTGKVTRTTAPSDQLISTEDELYLSLNAVYIVKGESLRRFRIVKKTNSQRTWFEPSRQALNPRAAPSSREPVKPAGKPGSDCYDANAA